jgi:integrase
MTNDFSSRRQPMKDPTAFWKADVIKKAIDHEPDLRNRLIIQVLFHGGMRESELTGIKVDNILWDERCVIIPWLKKRYKDGEDVPVRKIPLDTSTMNLIHEYLAYRKKFHKYGYGSPLLMPVCRRTVWVVVRRAFERIGVMEVGGVTGKAHHPHPHTLRHSYATFRVATTGGDLSKMQKLQHDLGHADIQTTLGYSNYSSEDLHREYDEAFEKA